MKTYILYGKGREEISVPSSTKIFGQKKLCKIENIPAKFIQHINNPIGTLSLKKIIERKRASGKLFPQTACIVVDDITRPVPYKKFLPILLAQIIKSGIRTQNITILVATGMHRKSTPEEKIEMFGKKIVKKFRIRDHVAGNKKELSRLPGKTSCGTVVYVNKHYMKADLKIVTGLIEPHFMAGFSGGRKSVCPGIVNLRTISNFHGYHLLSSEYSTNGILKKNPCHIEAIEVAKKARVDFIVNVTINKEREITGIFCGDLELAHKKGVDFIRKTSQIKINKKYDLVITSGGGYPLDKTFYQTIKGMVGALSFVKKNGVILIASQCSEGIGSKEYRDILFEYSNNWKKFIRDIKNTSKVKKDQWEFQMQCRVLQEIPKANLILYSSGIPYPEQQKISVTDCNKIIGNLGQKRIELQAVINSLIARLNKPDIAVIPEGPYIFGI